MLGNKKRFSLGTMRAVGCYEARSRKELTGRVKYQDADVVDAFRGQVNTSGHRLELLGRGHPRASEVFWKKGNKLDSSENRSSSPSRTPCGWVQLRLARGSYPCIRSARSRV